MKSIIEELIKIDIFTDLTDDELAKIAKISQRKKFYTNEFIFFEGDIPNFFYILINGIVKVYKTGPKNNEIIIHNFIGPVLVAETASIEKIKFPSSCVSLNKSHFILIKNDEFLNILQTNASISFKVIKSLTRKNQSIERLLSRNLMFDATAKIASYIYDDPALFKNTKNKIIATELHITPETLSRVLKKFKNLNIIDNEHNLLDKSKLENFLYY
jgi:CRP-like cAMP-binding protein